jgi:molybdate transport system substrate-binding protein
VTIALAAPAVPIGRYARDAFGMASLPVPTASDEADARAVVTRVAMGEADAGVVYATDVVSGGEGVEAVAVPEAHDVVARYPIATLKGARNAEGARTFVAWVLSPLGRRALAACGFLAP